MIRLEQVHKSLGGHTILDGVDLEIRRGETMVIVGRSGSGKSVTLKHMVGLMRPDSGRILVDGKDVATLDRSGMFGLRRKFGVLFQSGALINWLNVFDNVALPVREHTRKSPAEVERMVMDKLRLLDMVQHASKMPADLSGGMRKRASLARAIVLDPEIVLYDEPTAGLDPVMASRIDQLILDVKAKLGVTSVVVTHDLQSAAKIADRMAMLYLGKIIEVAAPQDFCNSSNPVVRQFVEGRIDGPME